MKTIAAVALAILMPGGLLVAGAIWLRKRWLAHELAKVNERIKPLSADHYRFRGHDEELREKTEKRREIAESARRRAAHIDSGAAVSDLLRRVK